LCSAINEIITGTLWALKGFRFANLAILRAHIIATGGTDSLEALATLTAALPEKERRTFLTMYHEERAAMLDAQRNAARAWLRGLGAIIVIVTVIWVLLR
jgi:hypothetical protein